MTILKCPFCSYQGYKQNLAEILPSGGLKIMRPYMSGDEFTIIEGDNFNVTCGRCNNSVYYVRPKTEVLNLTPDFIIANTYTFFGTFI